MAKGQDKQKAVKKKSEKTLTLNIYLKRLADNDTVIISVRT